MFSNFKESFNEMKSVKNLCIISLLMAMRILLKIFSIKITEYLVVGFGFLAYVIVGTMFGPFVAIIFGFLSDILGFYIASSGSAPFHWGFTLNSILSVLIYSLFLYKFKLGVVRSVVTQIVHDIVICFILNTYWLSQMYFNNDVYKAFLARLPKELSVLPINCVLTASLVVVFKRVARGLKLC